MKNFPEYSFENYGGYASFKFTEQYNVDKVPLPEEGKISQRVILKPGADWFNGLAAPRSLSLEAKTDDTPAGLLYTYTLKGVYPGNADELAAFFDELSRKKFVVDCTDNNNRRRLLGNEVNPCAFSFNHSSKESPSARQEYAFAFTWVTPDYAPVYAPPVSN